MDGVIEVLRWTQNLAWIGVGAWAFLRWRRFGTEASKWLAASFGSLGLAVMMGLVGEQVWGTDPPEWLGRVAGALIVAFPYVLVRFLGAFEPVPVRLRQVVGAVIGLLTVGVLVLDLPGPGEPRGLVAAVYTLLVVLSWVFVLPWVARRFWRAGRHQPTPARGRLRLLSVGTIAVTVALVLLAASPEPGPALALVGNLVGLVTIICFGVGLAPPRAIRTWWREPEERRIGEATVQLLGTETAAAVAAVVVPLMQHVVAADRVVLEHDGEVLHTEGVLEAGDDRPPIEVAMAAGAAQVWPSAYTPFFGDDELDVLGRIGRLADLALARTTLLASERAARQELQAVNAELEAFVYSASHDLKSPTIAILSYVEILEQDYGHLLDDEGRYYLTRMRSNGSYMEALVRDLLELSRVGRRDTAPDHVDLAALLAQVGADLADAVVLDVRAVPDLHVNALRARQLFQNLLTNAVKHAGHTPVRVTVESVVRDGAVTVLVRDDGEGVPAEYREQVFGVFEQLKATDGAADGTGMGLAICRKIMESFGGTIELTDHEGGAEFALRFPNSALSTTRPASMAGEEVTT